jgi:hypothetical protein
MPQNTISTWLGFALQQVAAESYLNGMSLTGGKEKVSGTIA